MSLIIFPKIRGTTIIKENFAANFFSMPRKIAVDIVLPDLDKPGRIAIDCAKPVSYTHLTLPTKA